MSRWSIRRAKPYTEVGVRRLKCIRCSRQAVFQWSICADGNNHRPLCVRCDIALNRMVLRWMRHPEADALANRYAESKGNAA